MCLVVLCACVLVSLSVVGCCGVLMKFIVVWVFLVLIVFNGLG